MLGEQIEKVEAILHRPLIGWQVGAEHGLALMIVPRIVVEEVAGVADRRIELVRRRIDQRTQIARLAPTAGFEIRDIEIKTALPAGPV